MDTFDRIFDLLQKNHMTQSDLSRKTGISTGLISQWKSRAQKPSVEKLQKVADCFNVSVDFLVNGNQQKEKLCVPFSSIRNFFALTPVEMAEYLNRDLMTVYRWEQLSQLPDKESLEKIANKLHTTVDILLDRDPKNKIKVEEDGDLSFISYGEPIIVNLQTNKNGDLICANEQKEKPVTSDSNELISLFSQLTTQNKEKILEIARLYAEHQEKQ